MRRPPWPGSVIMRAWAARLRRARDITGDSALGEKVKMPAVRYPAVAGAFYPADRVRLAALLDRMMPSTPEAVPAMGVLVPHAGYVYSGSCAGAVWGTLALPGRVILLGPNHTGRGAALAAAEEASWATPLGSVAVDRSLLEDLGRRLAALRFDSRAHSAEHGLEVQVPFMQRRREDVQIAPLVSAVTDLPALLEMGRALAEVIESCEGPRPMIAVSSDMTHYESAAAAREKDAAALERLEALDPEGLARVVREREISMCGAACAVAALEALRLLGARSARTVCYTHSGEVTGDDTEVVTYAGMVFS
ncbi:MAG: AmmeMemoRadiSam system protein B [Acidobacteriota bacterium]|nr:AmmeMemoRadiSam system protein B [Acidobacteriota bacterium]MDQ7087370.1 AmmeMemoRadiSam system protein B [Acidobacteriota bacterium]